MSTRQLVYDGSGVSTACGPTATGCIATAAKTSGLYYEFAGRTELDGARLNLHEIEGLSAPQRLFSTKPGHGAPPSRDPSCLKLAPQGRLRAGLPQRGNWAGTPANAGRCRRRHGGAIALSQDGHPLPGPGGEPHLPGQSDVKNQHSVQSRNGRSSCSTGGLHQRQAGIRKIAYLGEFRSYQLGPSPRSSSARRNWTRSRSTE